MAKDGMTHPSSLPGRYFHSLFLRFCDSVLRSYSDLNSEIGSVTGLITPKRPLGSAPDLPVAHGFPARCHDFRPYTLRLGYPSDFVSLIASVCVFLILLDSMWGSAPERTPLGVASPLGMPKDFA